MKKVFVAIAAVLMVGTAQAQQLKVSTGGPTGTYSQMFKELSEKCSQTGLTLVEVPSSGSVENIGRITGNQVNAGFVQTDVLFFRARNEDLGNIKTLVAFHPEEVHFVSKAGRKVGGTMGFGGAQLTNVEQLEGLKVGAAGGSFITAQVIRLQSEIPFGVVQFDDNTKLLAALAAGQVDVAVLVGGSPLKAVADLGAEYQLLKFTPSTQAKLKQVYSPTRVTYAKLNGGSGVDTISTDALLVTREYKTPAMVNGLAALRKCAVNSLDDLKETTGTHPKWQAVDPENKGKWAWYQLSEAAPTTPPAKKK